MKAMKAVSFFFVITIMLAGCASTPSGKLDFSGERPPLEAGGEVVASKTFPVDVSHEQIVQYLIHMPLEEVFTEGSSLPAIIETEVLTSSWGSVGDRRSVMLADGHQAAEELIEINQDKSFKYQVWGFTTEAKYLADYATGEFVVSAKDEGISEVKWTYKFKPKSVATRIPLALFVKFAWSKYMDDAVENMKSSINTNL